MVACQLVESNDDDDDDDESADDDDDDVVVVSVLSSAIETESFIGFTGGGDGDGIFSSIDDVLGGACAIVVNVDEDDSVGICDGEGGDGGVIA